ncbi:MAG: hypothetical protein ACXWQO_02405 [Bdellovibrionota bacterium]
MRFFLFFAAIVSLCPLALAADFDRTELSSDSFYTKAEIQGAKYETQLSFLLFPKTGWTEQLVLDHMKGLAKVYLQCGLKISKTSIYVPTQLQLPAVLSKYEKSGPTSLLDLAEKTTELPRPLVFLIGDLSDSEASPFSRANFIDSKPVPSALESSLWFPMYVNSPEYIDERKKSPYSSLAHELTHILTLDGDHNNDPIPNLLTIYMRRTNLLTPEICKEIVTSNFVKTIPQ